MALMSFREREVAWEIPGIVEYIELSGVEDFNDRFIGNLGLPPLDSLPRPRSSRCPPGGDGVTRTGARSRIDRVWRRRERHRRARRAPRLGRRRPRDLQRPAHDPARDRPGRRGEAPEAAARLRPDRSSSTATAARADGSTRCWSATRRSRPAGVHCFQWYAGDLFKRFDEDYRHLLPHRLARDELGPRRHQGPRPRSVPVAARDATSATSRASCSCGSTPIRSARRRRARSPPTWSCPWRSTTWGSRRSTTC